MRQAIRLPLLLLLLALATGQTVTAQERYHAPRSGYDLSWWTVDGGGGTWSSGGSLALGGTAGQPDAGDLAGGAYALQGGFWDFYEQQEDLAIAKVAEDLDGAPLYEGDVVRYVITVENAGATPHTNVVVQDAIPAGTTYVAGSAIPPQTSGPDPLAWILPSLAGGEARTFIFDVTVDDGMAGQTIGGNVAAVASDQQSDPGVTPPTWPPGGGGVLPAPDLAIVKTAEDLNGAPLYEGDAIRYAITVTNVSTQTHTGVVVTDGIPISTTYVAGSATPPQASGPDPLVWIAGDLPPGEARVFTFQVTVDEGAAGRTITNQAQVISDPLDDPIVTPPVEPPGGGNVLPNLTIVKVAGEVGSPPLLPGDKVEYHVLVYNPGTVSATLAWIEDAIPVATFYVPGSAGATKGVISGPNPLHVSVGDQLPYQMVFFHFRVTVGPAESITNTAVASAAGAEPVTATAVIGPVSGEGLVIGKTYEDLNGAPLYEGDAIQYVIGVANLDAYTHTGVIVTDAIPYGTTYADGSATPPQASGPDPLVWMVGSLAPGEIRTFTFRVTVDDGMVGQSIGGNVAEVVSDQVDDPVVTPPVTPPPVEPPGLSIAKGAADVDGPPLYEGDVVQYAITVTNLSTDTTHTGLVIQDAIPYGTTYVQDSAAPPQTSGPDPLVWTVDELAPGEAVTFVFQVTVDNGMGGQEIGGNVAWVISDQVDDPIVTPPVEPPGDPVVIGVNDLYYLPLVFKSYPPAPPEPFVTYIPLVLKNYVSGPPVGDVYEEDDSCSQARPITLGQPQSHTFDPAADEDWVRFDMEAGRTYVVQTGGLAGGADTIIQLYAPDCVVMLAENDDYGGELWSRIEWTATVAGSYAVRIINYDPTIAGPGVGYSISVQKLP